MSTVEKQPKVVAAVSQERYQPYIAELRNDLAKLVFNPVVFHETKEGRSNTWVALDADNNVVGVHPLLPAFVKIDKVTRQVVTEERNHPTLKDDEGNAVKVQVPVYVDAGSIKNAPEGWDAVTFFGTIPYGSPRINPGPLTEPDINSGSGRVVSEEPKVESRKSKTKKSTTEEASK